MTNGIESLSQAAVDNFCLNIFVQVLTNGINRQQLCSAEAISQKVMLLRNDESFNMIVKFNTDTTFQDFANDT